MVGVVGGLGRGVMMHHVLGPGDLIVMMSREGIGVGGVDLGGGRGGACCA